jgi:hypothetical protein
LSRIFFAGEMVCGTERRPFDPAKDIAALQAAIETAGGASVIVIDPIVSATAADSHKNSETRRGLQPLVDMAAKLDAALLGITHFTKGSKGRSPIDRVTGSVAFGALARIVMVAARGQDGDDAKPGPRVLMRAKSNIGKDDGGFEYELQLVPIREHHDIIASVLSFGDTVAGNARDILKEAETIPDTDGDGERQEAAEFLAEFLSDGPKSQKEVKEAAEANCHAWITIKRAKKDLGITSTKAGMKEGWRWALAEGDHQTPKGLTPRRLSTFGNGEHLRGESEAISGGDSEAIIRGESEVGNSQMGGSILSAATLIREAASAGVWIGLDGDKLALKAQVKPPGDLLARLKASKLEIIELLRRQAEVLNALKQPDAVDNAAADRQLAAAQPPSPASSKTPWPEPKNTGDPPFGADHVPSRYEAEWRDLLAGCPSGAAEWQWAEAIYRLSNDVNVGCLHSRRELAVRYYTTLFIFTRASDLGA